jgi:hypothetical protein
MRRLAIGLLLLAGACERPSNPIPSEATWTFNSPAEGENAASPADAQTNETAFTKPHNDVPIEQLLREIDDPYGTGVCDKETEEEKCATWVGNRYMELTEDRGINPDPRLPKGRGVSSLSTLRLIEEATPLYQRCESAGDRDACQQMVTFDVELAERNVCRRLGGFLPCNRTVQTPVADNG